MPKRPSHSTGRLLRAACLAAALVGLGPSVDASTNATVFPTIERFERFDQGNGLPDRKVQCVLRAGDGRLWAGTFGGVAIYDGSKFQVIGTGDGLSHRMVMCLAEDARTGDVWIGTMRGLNRYSAGRISTYSQTGSGLPNNVIYGLEVMNDTLWVATAAGLGALSLKTGAWTIYVGHCQLVVQ